jgi:type VI secretion system protein VasJ
MPDLDELINLGKEPIPGDSPAGSSVQYDESYEAIRSEMQKLESVTQEPIEWSLVIDNSAEILRSRSKHVVVAVYLTLALYERHDYRGLATGLTICRDLISEYWDTMEPPLKRKRGRIEAFVWLGERGGRIAEERKPVSDEKEAVENSAALMKELGKLLLEKLENDAPGLGDLERNVQQHLSDFEAAARQAEAQKKAAAARAAAGEIEMNTPDDARKALAKVRTTVKQVCDFLRKADATDPVPYRLIRAITWGQHKDLPPNTDGATQIPAVSPEQSARLNELHQSQDWANLIEGAEAAFASSVFWLDPHRWSAQALTGLGAEYAAAADAVLTEVALLILRLPELPRLKFADGTSIASSETVMWLENEVQPHLGKGNGGGAPKSGGVDSTPEGFLETTGEARRLAGKGQLPQAIRMLQEGIASTGECRGQFLWRLGLARLCLDAHQPGLATPHLEELEGLIERHGLEAWEPKLCLTVYTALLTARRTLLKDQRRATPELLQKTNALQDRLTRLDAAAALSLAGR